MKSFTTVFLVLISMGSSSIWSGDSSRDVRRQSLVLSDGSQHPLTKPKIGSPKPELVARARSSSVPQQPIFEDVEQVLYNEHTLSDDEERVEDQKLRSRQEKNYETMSPEEIKREIALINKDLREIALIKKDLEELRGSIYLFSLGAGAALIISFLRDYVSS